MPPGRSGVLLLCLAKFAFDHFAFIGRTVSGTLAIPVASVRLGGLRLSLLVGGNLLVEGVESVLQIIAQPLDFFRIVGIERLTQSSHFLGDVLALVGGDFIAQLLQRFSV